ncbi:MAG: hypothetical protein KC478_09525 [Bacteriovoracaceae bacterium]|nr:hypothetical protein [Bacteriovoracaceae bacterium]
MNILLKTTFLIIIGFSILNLALSLWFYYTTKLKLHALQAGFWLSLVFNFFIQGSASDAGVGQVILSYGFSIVPVTFLSIISFKIAEVKFPKKVYGILYSFLILLNLILLNFSIPFFWKSLPISLAISIPLFHSSYNLLIKNIGSRTAFQRLMGIILFLNGVNGINFAIFRMEPGAQLWGWIVAYALYQLIAVFLPALSLEFHNRTERERLSKMVEDKTRNLSHANAKLDSVHRQNSILLKVLLHDISNSIQVMSFQISKLGNKFPTKQQGQSNNPEVLSKLEDRLKMLFNLIQQVKEYESVKTGKSELKKEKVTLSEVREEINARFKEQMSAKNLEFVFIADGEDQEPYICADRS